MTTATNSRCLLALAIAAATLAGCTAQDSPMGEELDPTKPVALQVTSTLEVSMGEAASRATTSVTLTSGNIGIFLDGEKYTAKHNINYKYSSSSWSPATPSEALYLVAANANICAYYPYAEGNTDKTKIAMTTQPYNADKQLYYAKEQQKGAAIPGIKFDMQHAYSMVWLKVSIGSSYPQSSLSLEDVSFGNPAMPLEGTLNIVTGIYTYTKLGTCSFGVGRETLIRNNPISYLMLVVPQELPFYAPSTVTLKASGIPMTATIPIADLPKMEAGKRYTINIEIGGRQMVPTVAITPWEVNEIPNFTGTEAVPDI